ncbi:MAG TPA: hypothetical protein VGG20_11315 [Thermoanaerobaculia bacterium]|jgi:hypothetical protein
MPELYLKEIRRALKWAERTLSEVERIQKKIPLPPREELEKMIAGKIPFSEEAYVLTILQFARLCLEQGTLDVRVCLQVDNFRKAEPRTQRPGRDFDLARGIIGVIDSRNA